MAINKAMYNGINSIMDAYDRNADTPFYSVWAGKDMIFSYNEEDQEKGRVNLMENLIACEQNEHSDILKIKFHPKKEKLFITDRTPAIATLFVRVTDPNYLKAQIQPYQTSPNQYHIQGLIEKQLELMSGMNNRLALLEETQQHIEDDQEEPEDDVLGKIGAIINHPMIMQLIGLLLPAMASKLIPINPAINGVPVEEIEVNKIISCDECGWEWNFKDAGIDPLICHKCGHDNSEEYAVKQLETLITDKMVSYLVRLKKHDANLENSLSKLANMADKDPNKFKMLITYL